MQKRNRRLKFVSQAVIMALCSLRKQPTFRHATALATSAEIPSWWRVITQRLIGLAAREICFKQSEALPCRSEVAYFFAFLSTLTSSRSLKISHAHIHLYRNRLKKLGQKKKFFLPPVKRTSLSSPHWYSQSEWVWRSGKSTRLPPMWPGFKSCRGRHMWVEFVVGSLPRSKKFFSGFSGFLLSW